MKSFGIRQTGFDSWLCFLKDTQSLASQSLSFFIYKMDTMVPILRIQ